MLKQFLPTATANISLLAMCVSHLGSRPSSPSWAFRRLQLSYFLFFFFFFYYVFYFHINSHPRKIKIETLNIALHRAISVKCPVVSLKFIHTWRDWRRQEDGRTATREPPLCLCTSATDWKVRTGFYINRNRVTIQIFFLSCFHNWFAGATDSPLYS